MSAKRKCISGVINVHATGQPSHGSGKNTAQPVNQELPNRALSNLPIFWGNQTYLTEPV